MSQDFFKLISNSDEKAKLILDFIKSRSEMLSKMNGKIFKLVPLSINNKSIICSLSDPNQKIGSVTEPVINTFFLGGEKYFFRSQIFQKNGKIEIDFPSDLFHLQRRQSYRIRIPESYCSEAKITQINAQTMKVPEAKLQDLSSGGCSLELDSQISLKLNDQIQIQVWMNGRMNFETPAIVKHVGAPRTKGNQLTVSYGIEFKPVEKFLEQKVFVLTVELYRELYAKAS